MSNKDSQRFAAVMIPRDDENELQEIDTLLNSYANTFTPHKVENVAQVSSGQHRRQVLRSVEEKIDALQVKIQVVQEVMLERPLAAEEESELADLERDLATMEAGREGIEVMLAICNPDMLV